MAYENIKSNVPAFCCAGEYFYVMKPAPVNMLIQKTSYGDPVMTYPFSHEIALPTTAASDQFLSLQYDGINFWSLEKREYGTTNDKERLLRRWRIENFVCMLKDTWLIRGQGGSIEDMSGKAFVIENYYNILSEAVGPGTSNPDRIKLTHPHAAFFHVTDQFTLQSATQGYTEDVPVATVPDAYTVTTAQPIQNVYYPGDPVVLRRDLYFFNNASPEFGSASAAVYHFSIPHINASDPAAINQLTYKGCHDSGIYEQTKAATFVTTSGLEGLNDGYYTGFITYIRGQQLLFKRPNLPGGGISYPGNYTGTNTEFRVNMASMIIDNLVSWDGNSVLTVYDLATSTHPVECNTVNLYRLQTAYIFGLTAGGFTGPYNYVVSVMKPIVTSIALNAEPALVVANGLDKALIWVTVLDQYGAPMNYKRVVLGLAAANNAPTGYFLCPDEISECTPGSFTWLDGSPHVMAEILTGSQSSYPGGPPALQGQAVIEWRTGTTAGLVTVIAVVQP